jgi:hypothetical protein
MDRNALSEPENEFYLFQRLRNLPPALLAMSSGRPEPHHRPKVFPARLSYNLENSSIDGVSSRQEIDEKWPLPVPQDGCYDFSV